MLPKVSGIYFVLARLNGGTKIVYLGETDNFQRRWASHHRSAEILMLRRLEIPIDIAWLEIRGDAQLLKSWEKRLKHSLNPALNDSAVIYAQNNRPSSSSGKNERQVQQDLANTTDYSIRWLSQYFCRSASWVKISKNELREIWFWCHEDLFRENGTLTEKGFKALQDLFEKTANSEIAVDNSGRRKLRQKRPSMTMGDYKALVWEQQGKLSSPKA